jgi:hypothetical protein
VRETDGKKCLPCGGLRQALRQVKHGLGGNEAIFVPDARFQRLETRIQRRISITDGTDYEGWLCFFAEWRGTTSPRDGLGLQVPATLSYWRV